MVFDYEQYRKLIAPASIALVGVTRRTGKDSNNPLEMLLQSGYQGRIYPVNTNADEILGVRTYRRVADLPVVPELAVICAPRDAVPELFADCAGHNIDLVIIVAQGFTDGDAAGQSMQQQITDLSRRTGVRILGPNTLGVVNNFDGVSTSFMKFINRTAPVGVLCQSGIFMVASARFSEGIGIGIDTGNTCDLDFADMLGHMAADPRLRVINMHMEGMGNGRKFMDAALRAASQKPVLVIKTGRSSAGAKAAGSHTGSLAGEDTVFDAAFRQTGVIRVQDVEELSDYNRAFCSLPPMRGNRVGVVTITGGGGIIAVDACARHGLEIARYSDQTMSTLRQLFPDWMEPGNPVDVWPASMLHGYGEVYREALETVLNDPGVDGVICITSAWTEGNFLDISDTIAEAAGAAAKPVTLWVLGSRWREMADKLERRGTLVAYPSADRAARALAALHRQHTDSNNLDPRATYSLPNASLAPLPGSVEPKLMTARETFMLLERYHLPVAKWAWVANVDEAGVAAEIIGYPVALKVDSAQIAHKSDHGGVVLNITDQDELHAAWQAMYSAVQSSRPGAVIDGAVVQRHHSDRGTEVILGGKFDPQFGPVIICGAGGIFTEIIGDTSLRIPPLTPPQILAMLRETKLFQMLSGARGLPPADLNALIDTISNFCRLIMKEPGIAEIDINPLLASSQGTVILDARVYSQTQI